MRAQGKSLNEIVRHLHVSKSSASIWVRDVRLTPAQKQKLKEKERIKGTETLIKYWQEYRKTHPKIIKDPRWPQRSVENFFDTWTPDMAYVLGYFAADGCMYRNKRGSCYIGFSSADSDLVEMVKKLMNTTNCIEEYQPHKKHHKRRYTIQIGSNNLYQRLLKIGFTPRKSLTIKFPDVPDRLMGHFVRGYFDGDGCVQFLKYHRQKKRFEYVLTVRFTCGHREFLSTLRKRLSTVINLGQGSLHVHGFPAHVLAYSTKDARQLYNFMYPTDTVPHLQRKKDIFQKAFKHGPVV